MCNHKVKKLHSAKFGNFPVEHYYPTRKCQFKEKQFMKIKCFCQVFLWSIHLGETPSPRQDSIIKLSAVQADLSTLLRAVSQLYNADCARHKDASFLEQMSILASAQLKNSNTLGDRKESSWSRNLEEPRL